MTKLVPNYNLAPTDFDRPLESGEGITRTSAPHARHFRFTITFVHARPLRTTILATSRSEAEKFARTRHQTLISLHHAA